MPIVLGVELPSNLFKICSKKIIGLTMDARILQDIRSYRAQESGMPAGANYVNLETFRNEVQNAKRVFRELECHTIDVSAKAIEETSSEIFYHLRHTAELGTESQS